MKRIILAVILMGLSTYGYCAIKTTPWLRANNSKLARIGKSARHRLAPLFERAHVKYPPKKVSLLTFKKERRVELWAQSKKYWRLIKRYPLTATSGHAGPKLKSRDRQIPEGIYKIQYLNPFSQYHLSMRLNYPNKFDREHAKRDGRHNLGGDIFIHGKDQSVGCLAVGDVAIEELYVLMNDVGVKKANIIIAPNDIRREVPENLAVPNPEWTDELDNRLMLALLPYRDNNMMA